MTYDSPEYGLNASPQDHWQGKFDDPLVTIKGERRATVDLGRLVSLWFNTGSLCNLNCRNCYMESGPDNDSLAYITAAEVAAFLKQPEASELQEVGLTGGEPFMNPEILQIMETVLSCGLRLLVLTNATRPMQRHKAKLGPLLRRHGDRVTVRVSIDHYTEEGHEHMRGERSWAKLVEGLRWLVAENVHLTIAGRTCWHEGETVTRQQYGRLFQSLGMAVDANDPAALVLFPEMVDGAEVPEITTACWDILGVRPDALMCAGSRMVIKRRGADHPVVVPCTLLPYDQRFEMGTTLLEARGAVPLNHPHCAKFCVLGGGSCSAS